MRRERKRKRFPVLIVLKKARSMGNEYFYPEIEKMWTQNTYTSILKPILISFWREKVFFRYIFRYLCFFINFLFMVTSFHFQNIVIFCTKHQKCWLFKYWAFHSVELLVNWVFCVELLASLPFDCWAYDRTRIRIVYSKSLHELPVTSRSKAFIHFLFICT
jgi:hypothetical protein